MGVDGAHARGATEVQWWSDQSLCHVAVNEMRGAGPSADRIESSVPSAVLQVLRWRRAFSDSALYGAGGLSVEHADVLAAGPDNAGYRWVGRPTFRQLKSSSAQLSPAHFLREGDELVEAFAPMVVEAHVRVLFSALFVAVDRDRGVLRASAVRFEQDHRGKEQHAGCVLWDAVAGFYL